MGNPLKCYSNPRIDGQSVRVDASDGNVAVDYTKVLWVGSMFALGTVGSAMTATVGAIILFVISTALTLCLGHSLGMHRRFIHRSFQCPRWLEYLLVHLGVLIGLAGPFGMLRTHDTRDWAQRQERCHDYYSHASVWYRDAAWQLFCSVHLTQPPRIEIEEDIAADSVYQWMERTWMLQQLPWAILFYVLGGWGWVFWGICSRVSVSILGHWAIGHLAHNQGHRKWHVSNAAVQGYNIPWAGLITMGESWHNNHHAFPGSAKLGIERGQWDPGWWVIRLFERLGLIWNIRTSEDLPYRGDLVTVAGIDPVIPSR